MFSKNGTAVKLNNVRFSYEGGKELYSDFSLEIDTASKISLMGANGTGKSTLGKMIAKLIFPHWGDVNWSSDFAKKSDVFYLEQRPLNNVFPWQTVSENVKYPLKKKKLPRQKIDEKVKELCGNFKLENLLNKYPARLSGGELQRLALARCFSLSPKLLVLDEPFSALDNNTKEEILKVVIRLADENSTTLILITHNLRDTMFLSDRCIIIGDNPTSIVSDVNLKAHRNHPNQESEVKLVEEILTEGLRHGIF